MINFSFKKYIKIGLAFVVLTSINPGVTAEILAESNTEEILEDSETPSETNRGFPRINSPESLTNPNTIPNPQINATDSSNDNLFAPTVIKGTARRSSPSDIVKTLENDNKFQTLISILALTDLNSELAQPGFLVVFAPTEDAFDQLTEGLYNRLILPENRSLLIEFVKNHFVVGEIKSEDLTQGEIKTFSGTTVRIIVNSNNGDIQLNEATAKASEFIQTQNGLIVPINRVLFAPNL